MIPFFTKRSLKKKLNKLQRSIRDNYTDKEAVTALAALDAAISGDGSIEYFNIRKTADVKFTISCTAGGLLAGLDEINGLIEGGKELVNVTAIVSDFTTRKNTNLYEWLSDDNHCGIDIPDYYRSLSQGVETLILALSETEETDRAYYLRKISPLLRELCTLFSATLYCGLISMGV